MLVAERLGGETYLYTQIADGVMLVVQADGENATKVHDRIGVVIDGRVCHLFKQDGSAVRRAQAASARRHQGSDRACGGLTTGEPRMYLEKYDLKGRTAVVTGAGQGIGFACAQALGEAGARVIVGELLSERGEQARTSLEALGIEAYAMPLDVTQSAQVDEMAARVEREHGGCDILVNNAGVAKSDVRAEDTTDEHWLFHIDVNLHGLFWCCRAFGRQMLAKRSRVRSSTSARCPASSSTSRSRSLSTTPPRRRCIT